MGTNVKNRHLFLAFLVAVSFLAAPAAKAQAADAAKEASTQPVASNTAVSSEFEYILGPSDVLHIEALNHADFNVKTTIGPDNNIQLPYIGTFQAANMTVTALRDRILAELKHKGLFSNVSLQVEIVQYSSRFVTILGGVGAPGLVPVDRAYHLSEVLARAGGVREGGSNYVILGSKGGKQRRITVEDLATGSGANDPWVSPGDKNLRTNGSLLHQRPGESAWGISSSLEDDFGDGACERRRADGRRKRPFHQSHAKQRRDRRR